MWLGIASLRLSAGMGRKTNGSAEACTGSSCAGEARRAATWTVRPMARTWIPVQDDRAVSRMNTIIIRLPQSARRSLSPQGSRRSDLPATYIGTMPGFENLPAIDLYNLHVPVGVHPIGSTVSRTTLEKHGFRVPVLTANDCHDDRDPSEVESRSLQVA